MFKIGLVAITICLASFHVWSANACWSPKACLAVATCTARGGTSKAGLCPGANNVQCCSCSNCMDTKACAAKGGTSHPAICPGAANNQCCKLKSNPPSGGNKPVNTMLTGLADILRKAGCTVVEEPGWKTRGHGVMSSVKGIVVHHTAGPKTGEYPSLRVVRDGTGSISGPLAQLGLGRSGKWYVIAAGRCYHAGSTIDDSIYGNANAIGIEAEGTGLPADDTGHEHWPAVQWNSYVKGVKALKAHYGVPSSRCLGHKEVAVPKGRKIDPNFSMAEFRTALG